MSAITRLFSFGDSNESEDRRLRKVVEGVNAFRHQTARMTEEELRGRTAMLRARGARRATNTALRDEAAPEVHDEGTQNRNRTQAVDRA